jgi:hypothetical protein
VRGTRSNVPSSSKVCKRGLSGTNNLVGAVQTPLTLLHSRRLEGPVPVPDIAVRTKYAVLGDLARSQGSARIIGREPEKYWYGLYPQIAKTLDWLIRHNPDSEPSSSANSSARRRVTSACPPTSSNEPLTSP